MSYLAFVLLGCIGIFSIIFIGFFIHTLLQAILGYGVPYVPTPEYKIQKLLENIQLQPGQSFLDIGCGDGRIVEAVSHKYPKVFCQGIENSWYPYFLARKRKQQSIEKYKIIKGNFYKKDISDIDVIYAYLLPLHMKSVWRKISSECKPGTLLYSSAFQVSGKEPKEKIHIKEDTYFYVYEV